MIKINVPSEFKSFSPKDTLYVTIKAPMNPFSQKRFKQQISLHNWSPGQELWVEPWAELVTFLVKNYEITKKTEEFLPK